jgi:ribosome-associated protein
VASNKPSKSARKREYLALQELGEQLVGLSEDQLQGIGLEEKLLDAVIAAAKMRSHGALRRQYQLIGKLMRKVDPAPIRRALENLQRQESTAKDIFRRAEAWRDRILRDGQQGLADFFDVTGRDNGELVLLLNEYDDAAGDTDRRALRRKIFRLVHAELSPPVQNLAG